MAWFKVDDGLHASRKFLSIPRRNRFAAIGVWTVAGSWAADQLTNGHIPDYMLSEWAVPASASEALVAAGLWEREPDGFVFCNWLEYQPSKQDVDDERASSRERMRELRRKRRNARAEAEQKPSDDRAGVERPSSDGRATAAQGSSEGRAEVERAPLDADYLHGYADGGSLFGRTGANGSESVRNPDPTRPDPTPITTPKGVVPRKRGTRIPDQFVVTREMRDWAADRTPLVNVDDATERFVNYWRAKAGRDATKLDWPATWRNWLIKDQDDRHNRKLTPTERAAQTATAGRQVAGRQITSLDPKEVTT